MALTAGGLGLLLLKTETFDSHRLAVATDDPGIAQFYSRASSSDPYMACHWLFQDRK